MESLFRDVTLAARLLWKDRGFCATAIVTLAVCAGANMAIFTIVNSVLLRPLPLAESQRIIFISNQYPGAGVAEIYSVGIPDYLQRREMKMFEEDALFRSKDQTVDVNGNCGAYERHAGDPFDVSVTARRPLSSASANL